MLRAVHGNRLEELLAALYEALPPPDPFAPAMIVTGSRLVARWLVRELAFARGVAAGLELVHFNAFLERVWAADVHGRAAGLAALDRGRLGSAFASVLADPELVRELPAVASYLAAAPASGDRAGPRRVQLAEHLASLTWSYALTRPDWMPALAAGRVPGELDDPDREVAQREIARWQARLVGAALARLPQDRKWAPAPMLPWLRRRAGLPPPEVAGPVTVFGMSFLARAQLEALTDLAQTTDVTVYILDPCQELWDDVRKSAASVGDPLPLVLWGRPVRDTLAALVERTGGDVDDRFAEGEAGSALHRLLADVRARRAPEPSVVPRDGMALPASPAHSHEPAAAPVLDGQARDADARDADVRLQAGVTVLACPNPRREVEVIAAEVRRRLDADPTLSAHDLALWIAGDAEYYLALAPSAFDAVGVPCHLIDAPVDDRGRIGEAVLALLELPTSTMARRDLLRVMTHPAVLAAHPHVDAADWVRWTERLGIAHGADARAHANIYLADVDPRSGGHFHWDQGVRRLALGAFMVGDRGARGAARIAGMLVAPEELRPDQQASAATYALLVRSLCADAAWLAACTAPLARWADVFAALVDDYLAPRDEEARRDLERARSLLASLAHLDVDGRPVGFREAREHVNRLLGAARASRGEPLASGVMIAPLAAMRAVPFRIAFVAGLSEGSRFGAASEHGSALDLRREPRPGDVSPRDRDRAAFLEVLLGTREALYLSYVAVEPRSGQPLGPSSVVLELADALAPYLGAATSSAALAAITERHPLHRFSGAARRPDLVAHGASARHAGPGASRDTLPAIARERWACDVRDRLRAHLREAGHPIPGEDGQLALLADPGLASLAELRTALGIEERVASAPAAVATSRALTIANLRGFLEYPIQAWAQAVLGLDELPDDAIAEHGDEPFHLGKPERAGLLRDVFAAHLREGHPLADIYDAVVGDAQLRGHFPVGVFAEAARTLDLAVLETWRAGVPGLADGAVRSMRIGFGRAWAAGAVLRPALEIALPAPPGVTGTRSIRLVGQTELLIGQENRLVSIVPLLRELDRKSVYHLRGAIDHVVLAAAGITTAGHVHRLVDPHGRVSEIHHEPWSTDEAQSYLARLASELLDAPHGYLLPFDLLARALAGKPGARTFGDPTGGLGYGPVERRDGLAPPRDAIAIAQRRLRPLVERMRGDHGFEIARPGGPGDEPGSSHTRRTSGTPAIPPTPPAAAPTRGSRPVLTIVKGGRP
jgi:exodeoxyribonuclease V gamma subunit